MSSKRSEIESDTSPVRPGDPASTALRRLSRLGACLLGPVSVLQSQLESYGLGAAPKRNRSDVLATTDAIAATAGPGLIGGLLVGLTTAKAIALAHAKPLIAINHLEAHALTVGLTEGLRPPYLLLLVTGGHTQLLIVQDVGRYRRLGSTIDDALGEAFDKTAKLLGLGFPGGPDVERWANKGDAGRIALPRPLLGRAEPRASAENGIVQCQLMDAIYESGKKGAPVKIEF